MVSATEDPGRGEDGSSKAFVKNIQTQRQIQKHKDKYRNTNISNTETQVSKIQKQKYVKYKCTKKHPELINYYGTIVVCLKPFFWVICETFQCCPFV